MESHLNQEVYDEMRNTVKNMGGERPQMMLVRARAGYTPEIVVNHYGYWVKKGSNAQNQWEQNHADILNGVKSGAAIGSVVPVVGTIAGGAVGGAVSLIASLGDLFKKKPVGDKGWQSYINATPRPYGEQYYPSLAEILAAKKADGTVLVSDAKQRAAIQASYNQANGTAVEGDWHMAITNAKPITLDWYKGDSEHFTAVAGQSATVAPIAITSATQITPAAATPGAVVSGITNVLGALGLTSGATPLPPDQRTAPAQSTGLTASLPSMPGAVPTVLIVASLAFLVYRLFLR